MMKILTRVGSCIGISMLMLGCGSDSKDTDVTSPPPAAINIVSGETPLTAASITFVDMAGNVLAEGTTSATGTYSMPLSLSAPQAVLISVEAGSDSTMQCQAVRCGIDGNEITFGQPISAASLVNQGYTTMSYLTPTSSGEVNAALSVSMLSSLASKIVLDSVERASFDLGGVSSEIFEQILGQASHVVSVSFNLPESESNNVFSQKMPLVDENFLGYFAEQKLTSNESVVALVNGSLTGTFDEENLAYDRLFKWLSAMQGGGVFFADSTPEPIAGIPPAPTESVLALMQLISSHGDRGRDIDDIITFHLPSARYTFQNDVLETSNDVDMLNLVESVELLTAMVQ